MRKTDVLDTIIKVSQHQQQRPSPLRYPIVSTTASVTELTVKAGFANIKLKDPLRLRFRVDAHQIRRWFLSFLHKPYSP